MAGIALPIIGIVGGLGGIAAGAGFGAAEQAKMDELKTESDNLSSAAKAAGDLYDHTYYMVAVNLQHVKQSVDKLPTDFMDKVQDDINSITKETDGVKAVALMGKIFGYTGAAAGTLSGIIKIVRKIRAKRQANKEPEPTNENDPESPWEDQPGGESTPTPAETLPETTTTNRLLTGLDVAAAVFAIGGLAVTVGLGIWTLEKLNEAIDNVKSKMKDVKGNDR